LKEKYPAIFNGQSSIEKAFFGTNKETVFNSQLMGRLLVQGREEKTIFNFQ